MLIKTTTENTSIHFDRFLKSTLARTKNYKILWLMLKAVAVQCSRLIIKHRNNTAEFFELGMSRSKDNIDLEKLITTLWLHYKSCSQRRCFFQQFLYEVNICFCGYWRNSSKLSAFRLLGIVSLEKSSVSVNLFLINFLHSSLFISYFVGVVTCQND